MAADALVLAIIAITATAASISFFMTGAFLRMNA
jgi:hypothetical protein